MKNQKKVEMKNTEQYISRLKGTHAEQQIIVAELSKIKQVLREKLGVEI